MLPADPHDLLPVPSASTLNPAKLTPAPISASYNPPTRYLLHLLSLQEEIRVRHAAECSGTEADAAGHNRYKRGMEFSSMPFLFSFFSFQYTIKKRKEKYEGNYLLINDHHNYNKRNYNRKKIDHDKS